MSRPATQQLVAMKHKMLEQYVPEPYIARVGMAFARELWSELDPLLRPKDWRDLHGHNVLGVRIEITNALPPMQTYLMRGKEDADC